MLRNKSKVLQNVGLCSSMLRYPSTNECIYQSMWMVHYYDKNGSSFRLLIHLTWTVCGNQRLFYIKRHSFILLQIGWKFFKKISVNREVLKVMCEMFVEKVCLLWIKIIPSSYKCHGFKSKNKLRNNKTNIKHFTTIWSFYLEMVVINCSLQFLCLKMPATNTVYQVWISA